MKTLNYLSPKDLKAITLCCHALNNLVSQSKLMNKFTLSLTLPNKKDFVTNRLYRKIKNKGSISDSVIEKLEACVDSIQSITLIQPFFNEELNKFLEKCTRLESIVIQDVTRYSAGTRQLKLHKLKSLKFTKFRGHVSN